MSAASDQLRRCVRSVAGKRGASKQAVSSAFAICTSSLREKGYLDASGRAPTLKGFLRSVELSKQVEHAEAMEAYARMLERIKVHRRQRGARARGAANRKPDVPKLADLIGLQQAPTTPTEACARLQPLRHALEDVFACDTAYGDCKPDHPSAGHCFLASMMVQDLLGGEIMSGQVGLIPHYWVRVNGIDVDITGDQFDKPKVQAKKGVLYRGGSVFQRAPRERLMQGGNRKVMKLYDRLRKRVLPVLRAQGHNGIAVRIGAMT